MNSDYLSYDQIAAAIPECLRWTEADLISVGRQTGSPLRFIRMGNHKSPPMWRRVDALTWFARAYRNAPELVAAFAARLQLRKPTNKKTKATTA